MPSLIKSRAVVTGDRWVQGAADATPGPDVVLPLSAWLAARAAGTPVPRALRLLPPDDEAALLPYLSELDLVAVEFPSTGEGRGYTQARMLRERYAFRGELRAVGRIRADQIFFLARCGFDAFELADGEKPEVAIAQLERFSVAYQESPDGLVHPRRRHGG
jgi:uncharacterized protein (DUF934 family)